MLRSRLLALINASLSALIVLTVTGTSLAFGGVVWWVRPALAVVTTLLLVMFLGRSLLMGRWVLLKSPMALLGLMAIGLATLQLMPLPGRIASLLSPQSRAVHALGTLPELARQDDPTLTIPEAVADRTPVTLDRSATLRWIVGAAGCLVLFCVCSHFADRLGHSTLIWGSVVAAFFLMTAFGMVQFTSGISGLYGAIEPGSGRNFMPSMDDLASSPGTSILRPVTEDGNRSTGWSLPRPERPFLFGTMMGGPGAYLALGALGLPLALGLSLQMMAPRGSRQAFLSRVKDTGGFGLLLLMTLMTTVSAVMVGYLSGALLCIPFAIGILLVGIPGAWPSGLRWTSVGLTLVMLLALGSGVVAGDRLGRPGVGDPLATSGLAAVRSLVSGATKMAKDFPILGTGLGTYAVISPYYKTGDATANHAGSSLFQWWIEAGLAGVFLVVAAGLWCLWKLPGATRNVESGDRTLAFMLIGTTVCFGWFSMMHWSIELFAVALAGCAVAGTLNRWLAGGTDLFVESVT